MSQLAAWVGTPFARALAWTLVHFLWEGAVLGVVLAGILRALRAEPAHKRYAAACLILAAMPVAFAGTLGLIWKLRPVAAAAPLYWGAVPLSDGPIAVPASRFSWTTIFDHLAWLAPVWLLGVASCYARGLAGWAAVRRLRHRGVCAVPAEWQARLHELAGRVRVSRPVALLESCFTDAPVLIGHLRPAILLPLGCLTGLPVAQVECILLHELAHVARRDYVVNLLQSLVEGLLFYHPAVWWVSRVVRAERENCCDDRVVEWMGDARAYAATLAALEERRALAPQAAMAANGGNLMKRIRRLTMEPRGAQAPGAPAASAAVLLVIFAAALTALPAKLPKARHAHAAVAGRLAMAISAETPQQPVPQALPTPYKKWLTEDVAYIITDEERAAFLALASDSERENFIEQFWKRRDPTPDTEENEMREEHYRRIAYSNEHFAGSVAGWKTDRGRMYIVYGPPDEIDDHSATSAANLHPHQQWRYRYIEGIGTNVMVDFVDQEGTGDYRMTGDPSATPSRYGKWLREDAAYIISPWEREAFQNLTNDEERDQFIDQFWQRRGGQAAKTEHYRRIAYANQNFATGVPGWRTDRGRIYILYGQPDSIASYDGRKIEWTYKHIEGVGDNVVMDFQDSGGSGEYRLTKDPAAAQEMPIAVRVIDAAPNAKIQDLENQIAGVSSQLKQLRDVTVSMTALAARQKQYEAALQAGNEEAIRQLKQQLEAAERQVMGKELEAAQIQAKTQQAEAVLAQLNAQLGLERQRQSDEVLELNGNRHMILVLVPLAPSNGRFHVFGELKNGRGKIVESFEEDAAGGATLTKAIPLPPGTYRLEIVGKNIASGATWSSNRDFTVN